MSRRRSARLQAQEAGHEGRNAVFDERLEFLKVHIGEGNELPVRARFEHRVEGAKGEVEAVYWPSRKGERAPPDQISLFILGNPGLIDYYLPFLSHLNSLLPPTHAILCTSHIGHAPHLPTKIPSEIHELLESKTELVSALRTSLDTWSGDGDRVGERSKIVLIGHSLGGWLVCETMKRLNTPEEPETIHAGQLLFPSLGWMAKSWNGRMMWPLFTPIVIKTLPTISYLLRPILPLTRFPPTTLSLLRSPSTIQHCLQLARSELQYILEPDLDWLGSQVVVDETKGIFGIWSAGRLDGWVGEDGSLAQDRLGGVEGGRVRVLDGVPHAFCLTQGHSELVAGIVAEWLSPGLNAKHDDSSSSGDASDPIMASVAPM